MGWVKVKVPTPFNAQYFRVVNGQKFYERWEDHETVKKAILWGRRTSLQAAVAGGMGHKEVFTVNGNPWRLWG